MVQRKEHTQVQLPGLSLPGNEPHANPEPLFSHLQSGGNSCWVAVRITLNNILST